MAKTAYEKELSKQLRRINRRIKSLETRGYTLFEDAIPENFKTNVELLKTITPDYLYGRSIYSYEGEYYTGEQGRRIERSLASLKSARTKAKNKAEQEGKTYIPPSTNTTKTIETIKEERRERDEKWYSDWDYGYYDDEPVDEAKMVLENVREKLANYEPPETWNEWIKGKRKGSATTMLNILNNAVETLGEEQAARICQQNAEEIYSIIDSILYASNDVSSFRNNFAVDTSRFASLFRGGSLSASEAIDLTSQAESLQYYSDEE